MEGEAVAIVCPTRHAQQLPARTGFSPLSLRSAGEKLYSKLVILLIFQPPLKTCNHPSCPDEESRRLLETSCALHVDLIFLRFIGEENFVMPTFTDDGEGYVFR